MARSSLSLWKRPTTVPRSFVYYVRIWLPSEKRYSTPKSAAVLAENLGLDMSQLPPSTKTGARKIGEIWLLKGGLKTLKNNPDNPLLADFCLDFWTWDKSEYVEGKIDREQRISKRWCKDSHNRIFRC
ncbi:hypothetical protein [Leadbettera azotonutricia]|uniref:Uncharacterized protein n=1 Tax=Leadbettera azotonutricia (strain ATCC BAA-888 / DSM 13862 / ZAS-9) TaxID=545695 RepID=F5YDL9_LEAAZ|nr:hypothetical protein [Leadbettera azotonutricia]AEF82982.1 hypothetical protein TREAZ_0303 [Leadbettera azotonutricia ZAS-9]